MALDPQQRPSRRGWPLRTRPATTTAGSHEHELPAWLFRAVIAQAAAILVLGVTVAALLTYVLGAGAQQKQRTQELAETIRAAVCDLLDQLPEGGLLERPRERYGCGPGIPIEELPPDEQDQIRRWGAPVPAPTVPTTTEPAATTAPVDPMGGATSRDPYGAPTYAPPD